MTCTDCSLGLNEELKTNCTRSLASLTEVKEPSITFVVEGPGTDGDAAGYPLPHPKGGTPVGAVSTAFWDALKSSNFKGSPNVVSLTRCHGENVTDENVAACLPRLWDDLREHRPKLVVACGKKVSKYLTDVGTLNMARGRILPLSLKKGLPEVPEDLRDLMVTSTSSPGAIFSQAKMGKGNGRHQFLQDIANAVHYVYGGESREDLDYKWMEDICEIEEYYQSIVDRYTRGEIPGFVFDVETNMHLNPYKKTAQLVAVGFCVEKDVARAVKICHPKEQMFSNFPHTWGRFIQLTQWLFDSVPAGGWNVKFDIRWIRKHLGVQTKKLFFDGRISHTAVFSELKPHDLKSATTDALGKVIAELPLQVEMDKLKKTIAPNHPDRWHYGYVPESTLLDYLGDDVNYTWQMYHYLEPFVEDDHHLLRPELRRRFPGMNHRSSIENHQLPAELAFSEIEDYGVKVDRAMLNLYQREYPKRLEAMFSELMRNEWADSVWQDMKEEAEAEAWSKLVRKIDRHNDRERKKAEKAVLADKEYTPNILEPRREDMKPKYKEQKTVLSYYFNLSKVIYEKAGVPMDELGIAIKTVKGKAGKKKHYGSTAAKTLKKILEWAQLGGRADLAEFLTKLLSYKAIQKRAEAYVYPLNDQLDENDILRTVYNLGGARTGRASTSDPNLHGVPTRSEDDILAITKLFVSRWKKEGGLIMQADYSQLEMRIVAAIANDPNLRSIFEGGIDTHRAMAAKIFRKDPEDITKEERSKGKCVHPDTLVFVEGYPRRISTLGQLRGEDIFTPLRGVGVLAENGEVSATDIYDGGAKELVHVVTRRGVLTCTKRHRVALEDGTLKQPEELVPGDTLASPELPVMRDRGYSWLPVNINEYAPVLYTLPSDHLSYFAGVFLGDGVSSGHSVNITHGNVHQEDHFGRPYSEWQKVLVEACEKAGIAPVSVGDDIIRLGNRAPQNYLKSLGLVGVQGGRVARVPDWILEAGKGAFLHFLGGLADTDGYVDKAGVLKITQKDPVFIGQIAALAQTAGLEVGVDPKWNKVYERWYYAVVFTVRSSYRLKKYLRNEGKKARLRKPSVKSNGCRRKNEFRLIVEAGVGPCVDLSVDSTSHLYVANNFLTHNTIAFGILYGMAAKSLAASTGMTVDEANDLINKFFEAYPNLHEWMKSQVAIMKSRCIIMEGTGRDVKNERYNPLMPESKWNPKFNLEDYSMELHGYVETVPPFNRKRILKFGGHWEYGKAGKAERQAVNTPIQSIASDITLAAGVRTHWSIRAQSLHSLLFGFIHDSLKVDTYPGEFIQVADTLQYEMKDVLPHLYGDWLTSPIDITMEVGVGWGYHCEMKKLAEREYEIEGNPSNVNSTLAALEKAYWVDNLTPHMLKDEVKTIHIKLRDK